MPDIGAIKHYVCYYVNKIGVGIESYLQEIFRSKNER